MRDGELIVKRSFSLGGSNRQFVNGSPATLALLKMIGDELVDLHGPHDHQSLLSPDRQLALLDGFAHAEKALLEYEESFRHLQQLVAEEESLRTAPSRLANRSSICFGIRCTEITAAHLSRTRRRKFTAAIVWRPTVND